MSQENLLLGEDHRCLCISHLGKTFEDDRLITKGPKFSYKYDATYVID